MRNFFSELTTCCEAISGLTSLETKKFGVLKKVEIENKVFDIKKKILLQ